MPCNLAILPGISSFAAGVQFRTCDLNVAIHAGSVKKEGFYNLAFEQYQTSRRLQSVNMGPIDNGGRGGAPGTEALNE